MAVDFLIICVLHIAAVTKRKTNKVNILYEIVRLDGTGIESRFGRDFRDQSRPASGPIQHPTKLVPRLRPKSKAVGAWR
jgi:hypothetical protein